MKRQTKEAFIWITDVLKKHNIPFQISGGLAARIYGSKRPLADIDIGIPDKIIKKIIPDVKKYIIYGPKQYVDKNWNLFLVTLEYKGQEIDVYGADKLKMFDSKNKKWVKYNSDLKNSINKIIYGIKVPVISKNKLIIYKKLLMRDVDLKDIKALEKINNL